MKTTTIILAAVLSFSMNALFASNDGAVVNNETNSVCISLAPITPSEATFEDITERTVANINNLAPVAPVEADFSDVAPESMNDFSVLEPVTPSEADFSDDEIPTNKINLTPIAPAFADFTETI